MNHAHIQVSDRPTLVVLHSDAYADWVFDPTHPTQGRRFTNAHTRVHQLAGDAGVGLVDIESDLLPARDIIESVHHAQYVDEVLIQGRSGEWAGERHDLAHIAHRMVGGTLIAANALLEGRALTAVHFAGAKHHAMARHSSGFCVFNDFAISARHLLDQGSVQRIAILDIDAHHGDGTEALLLGESDVLTFSIHDRTIFPGTGHEDLPAYAAFNEPLAAGSGDVELLAGVKRFIELAVDFGPDVVFVAMGADGHADDPLSTLEYSIDGMAGAVSRVREAFGAKPMLLGGAGGYQPDTAPPQAWAHMALAAAGIHM